jgi:hypothetical protein
MVTIVYYLVILALVYLSFQQHNPIVLHHTDIGRAIREQRVSSVPMNIGSYIHWSYIPRLFERLTEEYNVYSSVMKVCSSVITDKHFDVSCSVSYTGLTYGRRSFDSFLVGVARNSFPGFPETHTRRNQCYVLAWDSCVSCCHCSWLVLKLRHVWVLFFCFSSLRKCKTSNLLNLANSS